jgi:hypothetical protein
MNRGTSRFIEILRFRRWITPVVVEVLFWATAAGTFFHGLTMALAWRESRPLWGLAWMVLGPLAARLGAELILVIFRNEQCLQEIRRRLEQHGLEDGM